MGTYIKEGLEGDDVMVEPSATIAQVCEQLQRDARIKALKKAFEVHAQRLGTAMNAKLVAWCFELCPDNWTSQRRVQTHFHIFFLNPDSRLLIYPLTLMMFRNLRPHVTTNHSLGRGSRGYRGMWAGYFYCVVEKIGQVYNNGDKRPHFDFPVSPTWVMGLLSAGKLSCDVARHHITMNIQGAPRFLQEIAVHEQAAKQQEVLEYHRAVAEKLRKTQRPWRKLPQVEEWLKQYEEVKERYQFLVLDGPSRMGKTCYARSLCSGNEPSAFLELNCAGAGEVFLKDFTWGKHELIIFDEITPKMVLAQRKVFQAGNSSVQLGSSATNCHIYTVHVHRVKMVLCTNNWRTEEAVMSLQDVQWLEANSVVVNVQTPLWVQPPASSVE